MRWARRRARRCRPCSRTSTCTTSSTFGPNAGERTRRAVTWSSCDRQTTSSSGMRTDLMPSDFSANFANDSRNSSWSCTRPRHACSRLGDSPMRRGGCTSLAASRRPSTSSDSRMSAGARGAEGFCFVGTRNGGAWRPSGARSRPSCSAAAISPFRSRADGFTPSCAGTPPTTVCRPTGIGSARSAPKSRVTGSVRFGAVASTGGCFGNGCADSSLSGSLRPASHIRGPNSASTVVPVGRAQCASPARWDLCGGRRATGVPTATAEAMGWAR